MKGPFDFHPKIVAAGVAAGLIAIAEGICYVLGVPAPEWIAPVVNVIVPLIFGYLKSP